jgi:hypothetical protein
MKHIIILLNFNFRYFIYVKSTNIKSLLMRKLNPCNVQNINILCVNFFIAQIVLIAAKVNNLIFKLSHKLLFLIIASDSPHCKSYFRRTHSKQCNFTKFSTTIVVSSDWNIKYKTDVFAPQHAASECALWAREHTPQCVCVLLHSRADQPIRFIARNSCTGSACMLQLWAETAQTSSHRSLAPSAF